MVMVVEPRGLFLKVAHMKQLRSAKAHSTYEDARSCTGILMLNLRATSMYAPFA